MIVRPGIGQVPGWQTRSSRARGRLAPWATSTSASLRLGRDHRHLAVVVDRHDVSVGAARSKPTQERLPRDDDRVGIGVRLDFEALPELGLQECVESRLSSTRGIDLSSHRDVQVARCFVRRMRSSHRRRSSRPSRLFSAGQRRKSIVIRRSASAPATTRRSAAECPSDESESGAGRVSLTGSGVPGDERVQTARGIVMATDWRAALPEPSRRPSEPRPCSASGCRMLERFSIFGSARIPETRFVDREGRGSRPAGARERTARQKKGPSQLPTDVVRWAGAEARGRERRSSGCLRESARVQDQRVLLVGLPWDIGGSSSRRGSR